MGMHHWEYDEDKETRICKNCKMSEFFDEYEGLWKWLATDEFMDCLNICEDE